MGVRRAGLGAVAALAYLPWQWRTGEDETGMDETAFTGAFERWYAEHSSSHCAWLAEVDGHPVGMAWLAVTHRVPRPQVWVRLAGNVQSVYVTAAQRGSGVGAQLVRAVVEEGRRLGLDYISVHPRARSYSLYGRAGFAGSASVLELDLRAPG